MDGWVIIGTELDSSPLDKKIGKLKRKLEDEQVTLDVKVTDVEKVKSELNEVNKLYSDALKKQKEVSKELSNKVEQYNTIESKVFSGQTLTSSEYLKRDRLEKEIQPLKRQQEELNREVDKYNKKYNQLNDQLVKAEASYDKQKRKIEEIQMQIEETQATAKKTNIQKIQSGIENVGRSVEKVTKKVGRWALAIIGIRSAYMAIRNAMNVIAAQDEQLAADLNYVKTVLAYTLEPIVRTIVEWMKQLVFYLGYIVKAWTGVDIFAKANKSLKKAVGSAKELNKELSLASFDEMNILQDNASTGTGGVGMPITDLSGMEVPKWLEWIAKNKKTILAVIGGITAALLAWKMGLKAIKALGIGIAVAGLILAIESLIDFLKNPTFENFIDILEGIAIAVAGVAIAVRAWPVAVGAAIALIILEITKHFDEIKGMFNRLKEWMDKNFLGALKNLFGPIGNLLYAPFEAAITYIKTSFEKFYGGIKSIIDGVVDLFNGNFKEGIIKIFVGLKDVLLAPFNALVETAKVVIDRVIGFVKDAINWLKNLIGYQTQAEKNAKNYYSGGGGYASGSGGSGSSGSGGGGSRAKGGIFYPSLLPKLALGGIINNPGPGVPYHGAVIGERGAEAVVPLTDSEQMQLLGETIGRYVTINATIPVYAYNRQVDRQIQIIRAEEDFAANR